jgi:hypothetical protein
MMQDRDIQTKFLTTAVPALEAALSSWLKLVEAQDLKERLDLLRPEASKTTS